MGGGLEGARILIADGEENFVRQAAATLHLNGHEVSSWRQSWTDFPQASILEKTTKRLAEAR